MKVHIQVALFALTAVSVGASGQCTTPGLNPSWDAGTSQFKCIDPAAVKGSATDESVSPKGDKDFCNKVQENLLKVCPSSNEGKTCRDKAKSIYKVCYKGSNSCWPRDSPVWGLEKTRGPALHGRFRGCRTSGRDLRSGSGADGSRPERKRRNPYSVHL